MRQALCLIILCFSTTVQGGGVLDQLERLGKPVKLSGQRDFLPPDEAFRLTTMTSTSGDLLLEFDIEPGYYLYRDKFGVSPVGSGLALGAMQLPESEPKDDPEFGRVEVYKHDMRIIVPVTEAPDAGGIGEAEVRYQGCAEDGICYPPIKKTVAFDLSENPDPVGPSTAPAAVGTTGLSASDRIARDLGTRSLAATIATFLGLGLLLAFTPCVFPMVPILSGIIVGQRQPVSTLHATSLSAVYVLAMAATYAAAGVAAGLLGQNLQAAFQHPGVLIAFAAVFVLLALSMFGFYELQLPAALQSRIDRLSRSQKSGSLVGVAVMGILSAIIVGPCVAPPLAGALAYIGHTGSALVGGTALFALGLGMGLPLLAVGASAGALLPRAGAWMDGVKRVFGVIFLGVAVWFLERILPGPLVLILWAALALGCAVALGALARHEGAAKTSTQLRQALGLGLLVYGVVLIVGASAGGENPLAPLEPLAARYGPVGPFAAAPRFEPVKSTEDVSRAISTAQAAGRAVMLDFYADWCIECKHLERETFTAPEVSARLAGMTLLRADVTDNDALDRALLERFELFGPPAVLFFRDGRELREHRLIGFADANGFGTLLDAIGRN